MTLDSATPESVGLCSKRLTRIRTAMQEHIDQGDLIGLNTLVARRGKIVHFESIGLSDREANKPMQADTLFRFYSMTKPVVCTALMMLYEQGKFDLKDPVSKFIPAFSDLKVREIDAEGNEQLVDLEEPVTIHHLLTHTSGLVYDFYEQYSVSEDYRLARLVNDAERSLEELVDALCQLPLAFQPGSRWYYSISIDVVARLVEIIAQQPLDQFLKEALFEPLGMSDMGFFVPEAQRDRLAAMYGGIDLFGPNVCWSDLLKDIEQRCPKRVDVSKTDPVDQKDYRRGGHGLVGTAEDYWRFAQMLLNRGTFNEQRFLGPKTLELMHMNHIDLDLLPIGFEDFKMPGIGFGLGSRVALNAAQAQILTSLGEYGWAGAAKTYYWVDPKEDLIGLFLPQSMLNFTMVERQFQTLVYQALVD